MHDPYTNPHHERRWLILFVIALTLTRTPASQTMPVGIASLITQFQVLWGEMMAVAAIYLLPVLAVTVLTQRGIVGGLMTGAVRE